MRLTEAEHRMRDMLREAVGGLTKHNRGQLHRLIGCQQTHLYLFLRGDDGALSGEKLDSIARAVGLRFTVGQKR